MFGFLVAIYLVRSFIVVAVLGNFLSVGLIAVVRLVLLEMGLVGG